MTWTYISELDAFTIYHKVQEQTSISSADAFSFLYALKNASTGATGTAVSNLVTYPLDLVCTRLQVQSKGKSNGDKASDQYEGVLDAIQKIYKNEGGIPAFYNGLAGDTLKSVIDSFLFFFAYNLIWRMRKTYGPQTSHPALQALDGLSIGFAAGAITKGLTTPIQNVVAKQQTEKAAEEQSASEIARDIYRRKGLSGFWAGYDSSLILTLNPSLTFFLDAFLRRILTRSGNEPGSASTFILAANGKATANVLTYPLKIVKSRAQVAIPDEGDSDSTGSREKATVGEVSTKAKSKRNPLSSLSQIAASEGVGALYAGVWGELFKGFFSHGLTMLVKEQVPMLALRLYLMLSMLLRRQSRMKS